MVFPRWMVVEGLLIIMVMVVGAEEVATVEVVEAEVVDEIGGAACTWLCA